ncbi:MAG: GAF domain-containing protein [Betaproteobacteria bacterium]|nr:GAF domain-containing protein [Betaproteobacteria bacterium]
MMKPPIPPHDAERVAALHELLVLDTEPEERFDAITRFCQSRFDTSIALVSLVDEDRQWFKSRCGLDTTQTPRDVSFCAHAILEDEPFMIPDARQDERFADNPLVTGPPYIRFYAGIPLRLGSGHAVGTLCLIDSRPRTLQPEDLADLANLARLVVLELERVREAL